MIDLTDPTTPIEVGFETLTFYPTVVEVSGSFAFVGVFGTSTFSLDVVDVSVPTAPAFVQSLASSFPPTEIAIDGDRLVMSGWGGETSIVDIADPSSPFVLGSFDTLGFGFETHIDTRHGYAYFPQETDGLYAFDISDPTNCWLVEAYDELRSAKSVSFSGGLLYFADDRSGFGVFKACSIFVDGFEDGGLGAWSGTADFGFGVTEVSITTP